MFGHFFRFWETKKISAPLGTYTHAKKQQPTESKLDELKILQNN